MAKARKKPKNSEEESLRSVSALESEIRDLINRPRKLHILIHRTSSWNMLCSCLDVIGDTEMAIAAFEAWPETKDKGEGYLLVYGILQTLFVQQDAVQNLCCALAIDHRPSPVLNEIRQIRNSSVGHPTKSGSNRRNSLTFNFIARYSLSRTGFRLMTTSPDGREPTFHDIDIRALVIKQRAILRATLTEIITKLRQEELEHRAMFRKERLQDVFHPTMDYYFQKIKEATHGSRCEGLGAMHVELIQKEVEKFKALLLKRGALSVYEHITYLLELIEYPLNELRAFFERPEESKLNNRDAYIFAVFSQMQLQDLKQAAKEIDEEYESEKI